MASIDWLSFTFLDLTAQDVMVLLAPYTGSWQQGRGFYGYRQAWRVPGVTICYDGSEGMGVHLQISGGGCALIGSSAEFGSWGALVSDFKRAGGRCTRVDIAYDDRSGVVSMDTIRQAREEGRITCRWHDFRPAPAWRGETKTMDAMYWGSLKSDTSLCVYDKILECRSRGEEVTGTWVRFELRFKREQAERVADWVIEHPCLDGSESFLASSIQFRADYGSGNLARGKRESWWLEFCRHAGRLVLPSKRAVKCAQDRAEHWLKQQAATFVFFMLAVDALEGRGHFMRKVLDLGWRNVSQERLMSIGSYTFGADYQAVHQAWQKDIRNYGRRSYG